MAKNSDTPGKSEKAPRASRHFCKQSNQIKKLNLLLLGNGNPKDGYVYKVIDMSKVQDDMKTDIGDIKLSLKGFNENYNVLFTEIVRVGKDLSNYIEGKNGEESGVQKAEEKALSKHTLAMARSRDNWYKVLTIIGIAAAIYFGVKNNHQGDKIITTTEVTQQRVEDQGVPFVMNKRGEFVALPDSTIIKWFGNDTLRYLIVKDKK